MVRLTGGQLVVRCLENAGVKTIFGIPGVNVLDVYDALYDSSIRHVLVRHEQSAAFMADAYARVTGEPGVCLTTAGPGLTNAVTGLATAYSDSRPVLALAGEISSHLIGKEKGVLHEIDQTSLAKPVTKQAYCVFNAAEIPQAIERAFVDLKAGRPRPAYVGLPDNVLEATGDFQLPEEKPCATVTSEPDEELVEAALILLSQSRFPLILAGGGVVAAEASSELIRIAELMSAPVVTTVNGAGSIPGDHPLFLGRSRLAKVMDKAFETADVMLAVGTRFSSLSMSRWKLGVPKNLIHVDIDAPVIGKNYPPKIGIRGDAKPILHQISEKLKSMPKVERSGWIRTVEELRASAWTELKNSHPTEMRAVMDIRSALERDAIVAADTAILSYWMQRIFPVYEPRTFLYPFGYVAMGYALPAAIASKIAFPDRQVVAVCGDGGFMVTCQDLATAVENNTNIPIILHNNGGFGILRHIQRERFKQRHIGVDPRNPDFVKLAESFGAKGSRVETVDQIGSTIEDALRSDRPTIVEIRMSFSPPPY